jgi:hypothetical protein
MTGALIFFADVEAFAASRIFWTKMLLVALLLANTVATSRLDSALRRESDGRAPSAPEVSARRWRRRRAGAIASGTLWLALVLLGAALASH